MCCLSKVGNKLRFTNTEHIKSHGAFSQLSELYVIFGRREILQEEWEDHSSEGY